jgi:hypothetical protein
VALAGLTSIAEETTTRLQRKATARKARSRVDIAEIWNTITEGEFVSNLPGVVP